METIAFDESGNTGADLLYKDQPIFALASSNLSLDEARELLNLVKTPQAKEAKFSAIKKSNSGKRRIIEFLKQSTQYNKQIKTTIVHKKFMVTTKVVDILIETLAHRDGIDLYKDGANIALSNMHYYCMSLFCGKERTSEMLDSFIKMIRNKTTSSVDQFYYHAWQLYGATINKEYQVALSPILETEKLISEILVAVDSNSIDPAIPAFYEHCANWGDKFEHEFDVLHDTSKPLFQEKDTLEALMSKDKTYEKIGYDRRSYTFPLRANGVVFCDSKNDERIQVVDLIASSSGYWAKGLLEVNSQDQFWEQLNDIDLKQFVIGTLWPTPEVDPAKLGTNTGGGINAVDHITEHLCKMRDRA
ncbi:MAG: DUF3800 domain-containing protein [Gammaproteobacteria bacterium]|nr:DUF3800 domain-containing protein [Gammaproteobacteria bacterium]